MSRRVLCSVVTAAAIVVSLFASSPTAVSSDLPPAAAKEQRLKIEVLSNRRDLVSGGDALVEVRLPRGSRPRQVTVTARRRDVTRRFAGAPTAASSAWCKGCAWAATACARPRRGTPARPGS